MNAELERLLKEEEQQRVIEEARRKAQSQYRPTFAGNVIHGATLGYAGDKPDSLSGYVGELLGGFVPYSLAAALTGGAVVPVGAALGLARTVKGMQTLSPVAQALIHGGMTGALAGGARNAESPTERLQNLAVEGTLGALVPAGIAKWVGRKGGNISQDFNVNPKPEPVPEDWLRAPGRKQQIPGTDEFFAEPDRFYPKGAFSKLEGHGTQLELPGLASYTPRDMRSEADMLKLISRGNVQADLPLDTMGTVKAQGMVRSPKGRFKKKSTYDIDPTQTPFVSDKPTGEITNLIELTIEPELSGEALRRGMFKEASTMPEQLKKLVPKEPGQVSLPFPDEVAVDFPTLATKKGFDIRPGDTGELTLIGRGGKVEKFTSIEEAVGFLRLQKPETQLPVELYGTFDKMINKTPSGKWKSGKFDWTKMDDAALRMQKIMNQWTDTPIGNDISEGIKPLNERMRINVLRGIDSEEGLKAAQDALKKKGYDAYPMVFGDSVEIAYMNPKDKYALQAFRQYNILRDKGPAGLGSRSGDSLRNIARMFGKNPEESEVYAWNLISGMPVAERQTFLAGLFETPYLSRNPLVQEVGWKFAKAGEAFNHQRLWAQKEFINKYINPLSKAEQTLFREIAEGKVPLEGAPLRVKDAAQAWFAIREDIANRLDISPLKNYFTHKTDYDALWSMTKRSLLDPAQKEMWIKKLGTDGEEALKRLRMQAVEFDQSPWSAIPTDIRNDILQKTMKWDVGSWDKLPPFLRNNLPEEVFNPHLIERVKDSKVPWLTDVKDVLETYLNVTLRDIHYSPILREVSPVINRMPGAGIPGTARTMLEQYVSQIASNSPNKYTTMINNLMSEAGRSLGVPFQDANMMSKLITLYRGREYGGLITLSTAMKHFNKIINTYAENGKFTAIGLQKLPFVGKDSMPRLPGVMGRVLPIEEALMRGQGKSVLDKAIKVSNVINSTLFAPMQWVEQTLRSISANASLNESLLRGHDIKTAMRLAMGRASSVMPDLTLTEAQMVAMRNVLRTDFGYDVAHMPALWSNPLARVSTIFMSYPTKELEFLSKGVSNAINGYLSVGRTAGTAANMASFEGAALFRYSMATGLLFGLPSLFANYLGLDASRFFGAHMFQFSLPFYQRIMNAYNAVAGDDPITREQARETLVDSVTRLVVPQHRQITQFADAARAIQTGYTTDKAGHRIATATPAGEILRVLGLQPMSYATPKLIAQDWKQVAHDYNRERTYATSEFIRTGKMDEIQRWEQKWGRQIEPKDLARAIEISNMPPEKRAQIGLAFDTIKQQLQQKPWMVGGM
jgi:hypothetical protein